MNSSRLLQYSHREVTDRAPLTDEYAENYERCATKKCPLIVKNPDVGFKYIVPFNLLKSMSLLCGEKIEVFDISSSAFTAACYIALFSCLFSSS